MSDDLEKVASARAERESASAEAPEPTKPVRTIPEASWPDSVQEHNQFNVPPIPASTMDKLSSGDVGKIFESSLAKLDAHDQRRSEFALDRARKREDADKRQIYVGGSLAALGLVFVGLLAWLGERDVAMMLVVFLATVIGVTIGGKKGS